jgi:alkanesulfonate monooxygenase SsuD/methylene tetrahydromethanopterin reductase-like flavin-dependent oxidoreductase (luciferase family)
MSFDDAPTRVRRLRESVRSLRQLFDGETVTTDGAFYALHDHELFPKRSPRLLVGGNGDGVLRLAARYADIVGVTGFGRTLDDGQRHDVEWWPEQIDAKVHVVRQAAGNRLGDLELNVLVQEIQITDHRERAIDDSARRVGCDPELLRRSPYVLFGARSEIVEQLHAARERWGFSYFVSRDAATTASIIEAARDAAHSGPKAC